MIEKNLQHSDDPDYWKMRLAQAQYLQSGDWNALAATLAAIPGFLAQNGGKIWDALIKRDFSRALQQLNDR